MLQYTELKIILIMQTMLQHMLTNICKKNLILIILFQQGFIIRAHLIAQSMYIYLIIGELKNLR